MVYSWMLCTNYAKTDSNFPLIPGQQNLQTLRYSRTYQTIGLYNGENYVYVVHSGC